MLLKPKQHVVHIQYSLIILKIRIILRNIGMEDEVVGSSTVRGYNLLIKKRKIS